MSDLYSTLDPQLEGILSLCQAAANAELADFVEGSGRRPIETTQNFPLTIQAMSSRELPMLVCWRHEEAHQSLSMQRNGTKTKFMMVYVAPVTPAREMHRRWPLLKNVGEVIVDALECGHDAYDGPTFESLGWRDFYRSSAKRTEELLSSGTHLKPGDLYPSFVMQFEATLEDVVDTSDLVPFLEVRARYYVDREEGKRIEPPDVDHIIETPESIEKQQGEAEEPFSEESN